MKATKKQAAILMAALCLTAPLSACGGESSEIPAETTTASATQPETTTEQTTTTTTTTEQTTTTTTTTATTTTTTATTTTTTAAAADADAAARAAVQNGDYSLVNPDFKATMDEYEAFYDGYINFMKTYNATDDVAALMTSYLDWMSRLATWSEKIDAIDEDSLSAADDAYFLLVTLRIEKKSLEALGSM